MFPAARVGDPITHDQLVPCGVIGPGAGAASRVVIEGLPAATVGCLCVCSGAISAPPGIVHPPPPLTPPTPIMKGSATVLIGGMPAARWTPAPDAGGCGVFLGDMKLMATRRVLIGG
jgi:uncharacterized Zn-binding protein involved in type VI secretion